jgi:superfamily II DNA/RNA helicase
MVTLIIPDKWQQDAVKLLREGVDVVVQAPTGSGKTYIFELLYESLKGQAVYTVPTRALANDKLAEWRARGWNVGISTGDLAENLDARVVVATLETQKGRFLRRKGPKLLVIDEYQLLADPIRGTSYEIILALAPPETQLLLLSGSVANPVDVAEWLRRNGRCVELIIHQQRPVQLDEIMLSDLPVNAPASIRGYWPKLLSRTLLSDLGPILVFAPRRQMSEELAGSLAAALPSEEPLILTQEQNALLGEPLAKFLRNRIAYHHSGLSYAVRAGIIEPLAKRGQLRIVVATMGLAAGINFSMRSVLVAGTHYQAGNFQRQVRPDELLQMFGRAGRRGLDEYGYVLVTPDIPRLHNAYPLRLKRADPVDWPTMIAIMQEAAVRGEDPFEKAKELATRLFSARPLTIGVEQFYVGDSRTRLCQLSVDGERARLVRRHDLEMRTPDGQWEPQPSSSESTLDKLLVRLPSGRWRPALATVTVAERYGFGALCKFRRNRHQFEYGRQIPLALVRGDHWVTAKWLRKLLRERFPLLAAEQRWAVDRYLEHLLPVIETEMKGRLHEWIERDSTVFGRFRFLQVPVTGYLDSRGRILENPEIRRAYPTVCQGCLHKAECETLDLAVSPALAWRELGLVDPKGVPTRRGIIFSFFNQGEGLAIAAALEQPDYWIKDIIFDLANLRVGQRFSMDESYGEGRLGAVCQTVYQRGEYPGYLELGLPIAYGPGASEVVRDVVENQVARHRLVSESVRHGDIERALTEWRSLLRQVVQAPAYRWDRWSELQETAAKYVHATRSPAREPLPALTPAQHQRYAGRLITWQKATLPPRLNDE